MFAKNEGIELPVISSPGKNSSLMKGIVSEMRQSSGDAKSATKTITHYVIARDKISQLYHIEIYTRELELSCDRFIAYYYMQDSEREKFLLRDLAKLTNRICLWRWSFNE